MIYTSREIRRRASEQLSGNYGKAAGAAVTYYALMILMAAVSLFVVDSFSSAAASYTVGLFMNLVTFAVSCMLQAGIARIGLAIARGLAFNVTDLFVPFKRNPGGIILVSLLMSLMNLAALMPYYLVMLSFILLSVTPGGSVFSMIFLIAACIASLLIAIRVALGCSQVLFLYVDYPEMNPVYAIQTSFRMMAGRYGRLFRLLLSMIGYVLLGFLSLGIGFLWVMPYVKTAEAEFYQELSDAQQGQ